MNAGLPALTRLLSGFKAPAPRARRDPTRSQVGARWRPVPKDNAHKGNRLINPAPYSIAVQDNGDDGERHAGRFRTDKSFDDNSRKGQT